MKQFREAEAARQAAENARRIAEEAEWARGFDPMDVQEALAVSCDEGYRADARRRNSAWEALRVLDVQQFTTACMEYGSRNLPLAENSFHGGARGTFVGKAFWKARSYKCWWLGILGNHSIGAEKIGVSPDGRWLRRDSGGEDYSQWSRVSYFDMTPELQAKIIGWIRRN